MKTIVDIVCHNCMGKNDTIHDQRLRKHSYKKNRRLEIEAITKFDDCFTIYWNKSYNKRHEIKNIII